MRLKRPISYEPTYAIWASYSPDLKYWGESELLLVAEEKYETGNMELFWRENVVFPGGVVLEDNDTIRLYYGAGDYCECLAEITLQNLLSEMTPYTRLNETATVSFDDRWHGRCS